MHSSRRIHARHRRQSRHAGFHTSRHQTHGGASAISNGSKLFAATSAQIAARALTGAAQLFLLAQLSRSLEAAALGKLLFYFALFNLVESMADLGLSTTTLARAGADPSRTGAWIAAARRTRWKIAAPACLSIGLTAFLYGDDFLAPFLLGSLELLVLPLGLGGIALQRELRYGTLSLARIAGVCLTSVLVLALLAAGVASWEWHLAAFSAGTVLTNLWIWAMTREKWKGEANFSTESLLHEALPLGLSNAVQQIYFGAGSFLVRALLPESRFFEFGIAHRVYVFALMVPQYLTSTALPLLAARAKQDLAAYRALQRKLLFALLGVGIPLAAIAWLTAPEILRLAFGPGKEAAADSLRWLALAGIAVIFGALGTSCLVAHGRNSLLLKIGIAAALLGIPVSCGLVIYYGPAGAALGCLAIEGLVAGLAWISLARIERVPR